MVPKSNGEWLPAGIKEQMTESPFTTDVPSPIYRTSTRRFQLPRYSTTHFVRDYNQFPTEKTSIKSGVTRTFGMLELMRMPFGLTNAAQSFHNIMHKVTQILENVHVYLNDILFASQAACLRTLLDCNHSLGNNVWKYDLGKHVFTSLRHIISSSVKAPLPHRVNYSGLPIASLLSTIRAVCRPGQILSSFLT